MWINRLRRWLRRRGKPNVRHWNVTVYTRNQCPCCHKAMALLRPYQRRFGFTLDEVDVDSNPLLTERYGTLVPVVAVQGRVRFKGQVNPVLFERILRAESGRF